MHAVQAVEGVSSVLKYSKRAAVTLRVATQGVETRHRYQKISKMRQWEDMWRRKLQSCRLFSVSVSCSRFILTRPLAHTVCVRAHTLYLSVKMPQHCSQIKREDKPLKWTIRLWLFSNMALLPCRKGTTNRKCNWHRTVLRMDDWQVKHIHQQKVISDSKLNRWSRAWPGTAPRD